MVGLRGYVRHTAQTWAREVSDYHLSKAVVALLRHGKVKNVRAPEEELRMDGPWMEVSHATKLLGYHEVGVYRVVYLPNRDKGAYNRLEL